MPQVLRKQLSRDSCESDDCYPSEDELADAYEDGKISLATLQHKKTSTCIQSNTNTKFSPSTASEFKQSRKIGGNGMKEPTMKQSYVSSNSSISDNTKILPANEKLTNLDGTTKEAFALSSTEKTPISIVVIGHVDAGKSTLLGHLLYMHDPLIQEKQRKRSAQIRKKGHHCSKITALAPSENFAWFLDEEGEERERGMTLEYHVKHVETTTHHVTFIDAPGHAELVFNTLAGAMIADAALLVIDGSVCKTERVLQPQAVEHARLVRAIGLQKIIVAINKMECLDWNGEDYRIIESTVMNFLTGPAVAFKASNISCVPISALKGTNLGSYEQLTSKWWSKQTLLDCIEELKVQPEPNSSDSCFRACISDVWHTGKSLNVAAKITSGSLNVGDKILVLPLSVEVKCRSMEAHGVDIKMCKAPQYIDCLVIDNAEDAGVAQGSVLCSIAKPIQVAEVLYAKIVIFSVDTPVVPGQAVVLHLHTSVHPAVLGRIIALIDTATGLKKTNKSPKFLVSNNVAIVQFCSTEKLCFDYKSGDITVLLSRLIVRRSGSTIAGGFAVDPLTLDST